MAQSSTTGTNMPMITCRDISTMDRDMARSVVFYVSGFHAASGAMQNQASGAGTTGTTTAPDTSSGTSAETGAGASTDATGSTTAAGSSDTASGASGGASSAVMAQLPGFSQIDIDRVMADCASSPDRQLSEMLGMGAAGSGTAQ
jgi:hypothetical protein